VLRDGDIVTMVDSKFEVWKWRIAEGHGWSKALYKC